MKPDETGDTVEFAIKLQDVLVPVDSHWPIEKFKEIDNAYQSKDKEALAEAQKRFGKKAFRSKAKKLALNILHHLRQQKKTLQLFTHQPRDYLLSFQAIEIQRPKNFYLKNLEQNTKLRIAGPNTLSALFTILSSRFSNT